MNNIYFSSDTHFGHDRDFLKGPRGFALIEEMNEAIIERFNSVVDNDDDLYLLGDCVLGDTEAGLQCLRRLNGRIHIILGNHDTDKRIEAYEKLENVVEIVVAKRLKYKKYHFYLSHYPTDCANDGEDKLSLATINIYGHTHQDWNWRHEEPFSYCVCPEANANFPEEISDIIGTLILCNSFHKKILSNNLERRPIRYNQRTTSSGRAQKLGL